MMSNKSSYGIFSHCLALLVTFLVLFPTVIAAPFPDRSDYNNCVRPGQSIQEAIDNARPGHLIVFEAGTYEEQLVIKTDGISLIGKGAILVPPRTPVPNLCTGLSEIEDHRKVTSVGNYIADVHVSGFKVRGFLGENIAVVDGLNVKVSNNKLVDGAQYGFLSVGSQKTLAESNTITASSEILFIAMCMDDESDPEFSNNDISGYFIALCTQTSGGLFKKNKVRNCCIGPFVDPGIKGAKVYGNHISSRNPACPPAFGAGIVVSGAIDSIIEHNIIRNIRNAGRGVGIFVGDDEVTGIKPAGNVIKWNILKDNDLDIFVNTADTTNVLANNKCATSAPGDYCD